MKTYIKIIKEPEDNYKSPGLFINRLNACTISVDCLTEFIQKDGEGHDGLAVVPILNNSTGWYITPDTYTTLTKINI